MAIKIRRELSEVKKKYRPRIQRMTVDGFETVLPPPLPARYLRGARRAATVRL